MSLSILQINIKKYYKRPIRKMSRNMRKKKGPEADKQTWSMLLTTSSRQDPPRRRPGWHWVSLWAAGVQRWEALQLIPSSTTWGCRSMLWGNADRLFFCEAASLKAMQAVHSGMVTSMKSHPAGSWHHNLRWSVERERSLLPRGSRGSQGKSDSAALHLCSTEMLDI